MRLALLLFLSTLTLPAFAQAPLKTPPYQAVVATLPAPADPAAVAALADIRAAVAAKDATKLGALLAPDFAALSCEADPTALCALGRAKASRAGATPLAKLRLAVCCGGKDDASVPPATRDEAMFGVLDSLMTSATPAPASDVAKDAVCLPALPAFDKTRAKSLAKTLDIDATTLRIAAAPIEARSKPERTAPVAATLPKGFVAPLLTSSAVPLPDGWTALALPAGGVGYAEGVTLDEAAPEAVCVRPGKGGWKLAILIGRQS